MFVNIHAMLRFSLRFSLPPCMAALGGKCLISTILSCNLRWMSMPCLIVRDIWRVYGLVLKIGIGPPPNPTVYHHHHHHHQHVHVHVSHLTVSLFHIVWGNSHFETRPRCTFEQRSKPSVVNLYWLFDRICQFMDYDTSQIFPCNIKYR